VDEGACGSLHGLAVDRERCIPRGNVEELLMLRVGLVVLADDLAFPACRVGVDPERLDPEMDPDRVPVPLALLLLARRLRNPVDVGHLVARPTHTSSLVV